MVSEDAVEELRKDLCAIVPRGVGTGVCRELLILADGDAKLVIKCSLVSRGINECKARIVDERFKSIQ